MNGPYICHYSEIITMNTLSFWLFLLCMCACCHILHKEIMLYTIPLYIHQNFGYQNLVTLQEEEGKEKI